MNAPKSPQGERPEGNRLLGQDLPPPVARTVVPGPWGTQPGSSAGPRWPSSPASPSWQAPPARPTAPVAPPSARPASSLPVRPVSALRVRPVSSLPTRPAGLPRPAPPIHVTPAGGWPVTGAPASPPARPLPWPGPFPERDDAAGFSAPAGRGPGRRHVVGYPVAIVAGIALGLALCGLVTSPDAASPAAGAGKEGPGPHGFGETVTFADGSTLTAGPPVTFEPDDVAFGGERYERHVKFKVTYVNRGDAEFDPSRSAGSVSSDGAEGQPVFETALQAPEVKVAPGERATWWLGYGVADDQRATLTVETGSLDESGVTFTNE